MPASIAFSTTGGQAGRLLGRDDQDVDTLADEVFDVRHLLFGLVLTVGDDQFDFRVLLGFPFHVLVELDAPGLEDGRLRESDPIFRRGMGPSPGQRPGDEPGGGHLISVLRSISLSL